MKTSDLRKQSIDELKANLAKERQELFNLRFQHATAQLEKTAMMPLAKKNIAKIMTIIKEKS